MLSDASIRHFMKHGGLRVEPMPEDDAFQPASLELTLGDRFALPTVFDKYHPGVHLLDDDSHLLEWAAREFEERSWTDICIGPDEFMLGHSAETVTVPKSLSAQVNGKSSLGRKGLQVHATAGFIDPGFTGQITLELKNLTKQPIWLKPGIRIAQLVFTMLTREPLRAYGHPDLQSHYQGQMGPVRSRNYNGDAESTLPRL